MIIATLPLIALSAPIQTYPLALKFSAGDVYKYQTTVSVTETSANGTLRVNGSQVVTIKVGSVSGGKATMTVSYSDSKAEASASGLPPTVTKQQREQMIAQAQLGMKQSLSGPGRSQVVNALGRTVYYVKDNKAKTMTISNGAFLMALLPQAAPKMGQKWTLGVSFPDSNGSKPLQVTYKLVGVTAERGEQGYKLSLTATADQTKTRDGAKLNAHLELSGWVVIGSKSGKVIRGEFTRMVKGTFTPPKGAVQKSSTIVTQAYRLS